MANLLADARGERIESDLTPDQLTDMLLNRIDASPAATAGARAAGSFCGGEADGASSRLLGWLGVLVPSDGRTEWADVAAWAEYRPEGISDAALAVIERQAVEYAAEEGADGDLMVGMHIRELAERFARHAAERAIEQHFDDAHLAGIEAEHSNVDLECEWGDDDAQVYTGSSSKKWHDKTSEAPNAAGDVEYHHREACEFDIFVFVRIEDGAFKVGARDVMDPEAMTAYAASGK